MGNLLGRNDGNIADEDRKFNMNEPNERYGNNEIKSTSSTVLTFVPLNLLHQFSNVPNSTSVLNLSLFPFDLHFADGPKYFGHRGKTYHLDST